MVELNGALRLHPSLRHAVLHVGSEGSPVLVIDDFLSDPHVLIDFAAAHSEFRGDVDPFYPGVRATIPQIYSFAIRAFLGRWISEAFSLGGSEVVRERSHFSLVTTRPEQLVPLQRVPHFDNTDDRQLAVLHYLSPEPQGGTSFYRHRATGLEAILPARLAAHTESRDRELRQPPGARYIDGDTADYVRIASVDGKFNRLIVYRGLCLHSADIAAACGFSNDPRRGRLTANTFLVFR